MSHFLKNRLATLRIVGIYALVGFIWIYASDTALGWFVHDQQTMVNIAIYKGSFFLFSTSLLLYLLINRYSINLAVSEQALKDQVKSLLESEALRTQNELEIQRLGDMYAALSRCGQAIVTCRSEEELFLEMCKVIVTIGGKRMAWIGLTVPETMMLRVAACYGSGVDYLDGIVMSVDADSALGRGPTGSAIREKRPFWCKNFQNDPATAPWHDLGLEYGWKASASLPLFRHGEAIGAFTLYSDTVNDFDDANQKLLIEMADNVSYALDNFAIEASRKLTEAEQKSAKEALSKSEIKYRQLFQNQPSGFALHEIIVDEAGKPFDYRFLELNPAFEKLTGLKASDLIGNTQLEVIPNSEPYWVETYGKVALAGTTVSFDNYSDVLKKHYHVTAYSPEVGKFATVFMDITALKLAEDALKESEYRWKFALEGSGDGVWDWNIKTGQAFYSSRYKEMLGFAENEIGNTSDEWLKRLHPEDAPGVITGLEPYLGGKTGSASVEFRMLCKDGSWKWILGRGMVVSRDSDGNPLRMIGTNTDITDRKKAEEEKQTLEYQLQHTQKLESLGVLSGGIAHDFNNILAIIIGYCGMTKLNYGMAEKNIPIIEDAAERAAGLCRQMLAYAGKAQLTKSKISMVENLEEIVGMLKATLPRNAEIKTDFSAEIPLIEGDASQLRQVVMNLIINASEAIATEQGVVDVSLARIKIVADNKYEDYHGKPIPPGEYVCLEVTDNGCGMDEETKWRIFEPFYTTKFTGRGLGMSAVLGIIKSHAGALQLFSQQGHGTTFKVYLPTQVSDNAVDEDQAVSADAATWKVGSGTILLADDEEPIRDVAKNFLEMFGFTVLEAVNGREALEIYKQNAAEITIVITDLGMPVMDGYELFSELKKLNPELPIILSSGYGDAEVSARMGSANISGIISKPYNPGRLREALKSVFNDSP